MSDWWNSLDSVMKILYCIAIPASILLLVQTILALVGFGHGGSGIGDSDTSGLAMDGANAADITNFSDTADFTDGGNPADISTLRLFSLQGIVTFFAVFSWVSIVSIGSGTPEFFGIPLGFLFGCIAMYGVAKLAQLTAKLAKNGNLNLKNAIGECGTVYLPIQGNGESVGKITLNLQGQFGEFNAITYEPDVLKTGTVVRVTDLRGDTLVVETEK